MANRTEDHASCDSGRLDEAIRWLIDTPIEKRPTATMTLLRELFGISSLEAIEAIRSANARRFGGNANAS